MAPLPHGCDDGHEIALSVSTGDPDRAERFMT